MKIFIVLLRGINVGGHRKMPMAELREILSTLGYINIQTYIQTGNVILSSDKPTEKIKSAIEKEIVKHFGFEVSVLVKSQNELQKIFKECPFTIEEKEKSYFMILEDVPNEVGIKEVEDITYEDEIFKITDNCIYFYSAKGYGRTKFNSNFFERKLKVKATARNHKTMLKLLAIAEEAESNI